MQRTDVPFNFLPCLEHLLGGERAIAFRGQDRTGEGALFGFLLGHQVGAAQLLQLDAVLQYAQLLVVAAERFGVGAANVADGGQRRERIHGGLGAHGGVSSTVHELQQLHGELNIAQAARTQLNLAVYLV